MARKVITSYVDDIDGSEADGTVNFSFDGVNYEIDLSDKNKEKLHKALEPYIAAGRRIGGSRRSSGSKSNSAELQKIREWAAENGIEVSARGRIAQSVIDQYNAAN